MSFELPGDTSQEELLSLIDDLNKRDDTKYGTMLASEIIGAVKEENDQSLDIRDLDACCARILGLIRKLCC